MVRDSRWFSAALVVFAALGIGCGGSSTPTRGNGGQGGGGGMGANGGVSAGGATTTGGMTATGGAGPGVVPWWTLPSGSRYFEHAGRRAPFFLRNATAGSAADFEPLLAAAHAAGADAIRIQLTQGLGYETLGIDSHGNVLPAWASAWDQVLDQAAAQNLAVIPVFAIWGDWNDGTPAAGWSHFDANPLNKKNGGPAASPAELFDDTETSRAWLGWLGTLIDRWQNRPNISAWEVFSELDLATGANETNATAFAERASDLIRAHDAAQRPLLASTSDLPLIQGAPWTKLWASRANDVVSLHPYAADLDARAVLEVAQARSQAQKPILIGESGLDAAAPDGATITTSAYATVGLEQAIFAELASGAADARAFYWEDGYATYYPESGTPFVQSMNGLETRAVAWIHDLSFDGLEPAAITTTPLTFDVALASTTEVLGFMRASDLTAPGWMTAPVPSAVVQIALAPGSPSSGHWEVELQTLDGTPFQSVTVPAGGASLAFSVDDPFTSLVFTARAKP